MILNDNLVTSNNKNINNEYSFNCIPRYFVAEGFLSLDYSGKECQIGIALKDFLNIRAGSIVSIERQGQILIIKSYYNPTLSLFEIQTLLKIHINDFEKYPQDGIYNENIFHFKLTLTQDN
jgi:hypothetical protein